jgi:hypothetical protein
MLRAGGQLLSDSQADFWQDVHHSPSQRSDLLASRCVEERADPNAARSPLLARLTIRGRPGKRVFRYWQEGDGRARGGTKAMDNTWTTNGPCSRDCRRTFGRAAKTFNKRDGGEPCNLLPECGLPVA